MVMWLPNWQSWATWQQAIRKLWSPTRVTPSSFSDARLIVTHSRMMLWSPMSDLGVAAGVADVLRVAADDGVGIDVVVAAEGDAAHQGDVVFQAGAASDPHLRPDDAERPDLDFIVDFGAGVDDGVLGEVVGHVRGSFTVQHELSAFVPSGLHQRLPCPSA